MPAAFRITTVGAYHLKKWATTFAYLDAMVFDTPIFDSDIMDKLTQDPESFGISDRAHRSTIFRSYLNKVWHNSGIAPPYFDWTSLLPVGEISFKKVEWFISKQPATYRD